MLCLRKRSHIALMFAVGFGATAAAWHSAPSVQAQTATISIANFAFSPATLTVAVGTTVTWHNSDGVQHAPTSDDDAWTTGIIDGGQSASHTFNQPGTFSYHCSVHPSMTGTIIVQSGGPTATAIPTSVPPPPTSLPPSNTPLPATSTPVILASSPTSVPPTATAIPLTTTPVPPTATAVPPTATPTPSHRKTSTVTAKRVHGRFVFGQVTVRIKAGTVVFWKNATGAAHTVTSITKGWVFNKPLKPGATVRYTFKKSGTFRYVCSFHPGMGGTVIVKK